MNCESWSIRFLVQSNIAGFDLVTGTQSHGCEVIKHGHHLGERHSLGASFCGVPHVLFMRGGPQHVVSLSVPLSPLQSTPPISDNALAYRRCILCLSGAEHGVGPQGDGGCAAGSPTLVPTGQASGRRSGAGFRRTPCSYNSARGKLGEHLSSDDAFFHGVLMFHPLEHVRFLA